LQMLPREHWAVATSGPRADATARLRQAGLPIPGVLICAEDVVHGKPAPDAYLMAAAALAAAPSDCVVVEDAPAGIQAARAAGMGVIALTTTHARDDLPADAWVTSLAGIRVGRIHQGSGAGQFIELLLP
jgi:sugar-phosphatase